MASKKSVPKKAAPAKKAAAPAAGGSLTPSQKKLPPFIQKAIMSKKSKGKK